MRIKWGALVVDGSGKLGGHVAAKNKGGNYMRTKTTPANPQTVSQQEVRNRLTGLAQAWRGLTQVQRDAWNSAVNDFKAIGLFGDTIVPSGFNLYCKLNANLLLIGEAAIDTPPVPSAVGALTTLSFTMANAVPAMSVTFADALTADQKLILEATTGVSQGKNFVKSEFRVIGVMDNGDVSPFNALALYTAKFGAVPPIGQKVFIRATMVNVNTGQAGIGLVADYIIVA